MAELDRKNEKPTTPESPTPTPGQSLFAQWHRYLKANQTLPGAKAQIRAQGEFQNLQWPIDMHLDGPMDTGTPNAPQRMVLVRATSGYYHIYSFGDWVIYTAKFRHASGNVIPDPIENDKFIDCGPANESITFITACDLLRLGFRPTQAQWEDIASRQLIRPLIRPTAPLPVAASAAALEAQRAVRDKARAEYKAAQSTLDLTDTSVTHLFNARYAAGILDQFPRPLPQADADPEDISTPRVVVRDYPVAKQIYDHFKQLEKFNFPTRTSTKEHVELLVKKLIALETAELRLAIMEAQPAPEPATPSLPQEIKKSPETIKKEIAAISAKIHEILEKICSDPAENLAISSAIDYGVALARKDEAKPLTLKKSIDCMSAYQAALRHPANVNNSYLPQSQPFSKKALAAIEVGKYRVKLTNYHQQLVALGETDYQPLLSAKRSIAASLIATASRPLSSTSTVGFALEMKHQQSRELQIAPSPPTAETLAILPADDRSFTAATSTQLDKPEIKGSIGDIMAMLSDHSPAPSDYPLPQQMTEEAVDEILEHSSEPVSQPSIETPEDAGVSSSPNPGFS